MGNSRFLEEFLKELNSGLDQVQTNNRDLVKYPLLANPVEDIKTLTKNTLRGLARAKRYVLIHETLLDFLVFVLSHSEEFEDCYLSLSDEASRQLMIKLLVFRILGDQFVKLPSNNSAYWDAVKLARGTVLKKPRTIRISSLNGYLDYYELHDIGFPICVHAHALNILDTFLLQQYKFDRADRVVQVESGDIVIDAGACWGDSSLYFAYKAGEDGKIYCFEFLSSNLKILQKNLELNQALKNRIEISPNAVWSKTGEKLGFREMGPATRLTPDHEQSFQVETVTIDDFVRQQRLRRVDFIKMDIEGAELDALEGARQTIVTFKPKLAIAMYHKTDDFITVPRYFKDLELGYEFSLAHFSIHLEETVLFAIPVK